MTDEGSSLRCAGVDAMNECQIICVGTTPPQILASLVGPLRTALRVSSEVGSLALPEEDYAFNKERNQYHASAILRRIQTTRDLQAQFALAVTSVDLFEPDTPHVFGEADRTARVALMSIARFGTEFNSLSHRNASEAVHLVGHLIGLAYCEDPRCAMFVATTVAELDKRSASLCTSCRSELQKLRPQAT